jgi:hypothetical protein
LQDWGIFFRLIANDNWVYVRQLRPSELGIETRFMISDYSRGFQTFHYRYYGAVTFNVSQIEVLLKRVPSSDETPITNLKLNAELEIIGSLYMDKLDIWWCRSSVVTWTVPITVPRVTVHPEQCSFPSTVNRDAPFDIEVGVTFQPTISAASYVRDYIEAEYSGVRTTLWQRETYATRPTTQPELITITGISIQDIVGIVPWSQGYELRIIAGTIATGLIGGTSEWPWSRADEEAVAWNVYVAAAPPDPDFLPPPDTVYPPDEVGIDQTFSVVMAAENYGSRGDIYIAVNGREAWRGWLEYLGVGSWRSGSVTIGQLVGYDIVSEGDVGITFECGYIDDTGAKVATRTLVLYVAVVRVRPAPEFVLPPASVYPPYIVSTDQVFQVTLTVVNSGLAGEAYIAVGTREVWRSWLNYLGRGSWASGSITVEELVGYEITRDGEIQVTFECGYIDQTGKVATAFSPRSIFVYLTEVPPPPPGTANLHGTVEDEDGAAIAGAQVAANGHSATSGANGYYSFAGLEAGYYDLECAKEGYESYSLRVYLAAGDNHRDIILVVAAGGLPSWVLPAAIVVGGVVLYGATRRKHG